MPRQVVEYHPVLGHRYVPALKLRVPHESGGYLLQTNSLGFRSHHDFERRRPASKGRVLLFGDSFTAGDGVSNSQRYSDVLEVLRPDLEVYNFGLPGSGTDQQYLAWREFAQDLEADQVVLAFQPENLRRNASMYRLGRDPAGHEACYAKPFFTLQESQLVVGHQPVPREPRSMTDLEGAARVDTGGRFPAVRKAVNALGLRDIAQKVSGYRPLPEYDDPRHPDWLLTRAILLDWISRVRVPVTLLFVPLYYHLERSVDASQVQARLRELATQASATLIDPLPELLALPADTRRGFRFAKDIHPTPAYHRALATILSRDLPRGDHTGRERGLDER
jgi:carbamoyltransferase